MSATGIAQVEAVMGSLHRRWRIRAIDDATRTISSRSGTLFTGRPAAGASKIRARKSALKISAAADVNTRLSGVRDPSPDATSTTQIARAIFENLGPRIARQHIENRNARGFPTTIPQS